MADEKEPEHLAEIRRVLEARPPRSAASRELVHCALELLKGAAKLDASTVAEAPFDVAVEEELLGMRKIYQSNLHKHPRRAAALLSIAPDVVLQELRKKEPLAWLDADPGRMVRFRDLVTEAGDAPEKRTSQRRAYRTVYHDLLEALGHPVNRNTAKSHARRKLQK